MILRPVEGEAPGAWVPSWIQRRSTRLLLGASAIVLFVVFARQRQRIRDFYLRDLPDKIRVVRNRWEGRNATPRVFSLAIGHEDFMRIAYKRQEALAMHLLISGSEDYVPGRIQSGKESAKVKLRLKGDSADHWDSDKWSLKIKVRKGRAFCGMTAFCIQHPKTRDYLEEWVFHRLMDAVGVLSCHYEFVRVVLNGEDKGIYACEENFANEFVELRKRPAGPILRFSEDRYFHHSLLDLETTWDRDVSFLEIGVSVYDQKKLRADPEQRMHYQRALTLLEAYKQGRVKRTAIFNKRLLARFVAITDLAGAPHALSWHNMRLYYNPVTSKFEPIAYDAEAGRILGTFLFHGSTETQSELDLQLLEDPEFLDHYIQALDEVTKPEFLETFWAQHDSEFQDALITLHSEYPEYAPDFGFLEANAARIRHFLYPKFILQAYGTVTSDRRVELRVANIQALPVEITAIIVDGRRVALPTPYPVDERHMLEPMRFQTFTPDLTLGPDELPSSVQVESRVRGIPRAHLTAVDFAGYLPDVLADPRIPESAPNIDEFPWLDPQPDAERLLVRPGEWTIADTVRIPPDLQVIVSPGTALHLTNKAAIISRSAWEAHGTPDRPIILDSPDNTGLGLLILETDRPSTFEHVVFRRLAAPELPGWRLRGAVTFYDSDVSLSQCLFEENRGSDDALNLVRSPFSLSQCAFRKTAADAVDVDFSRGKMNRLAFNEIGNDGVDVSGATVEASELRFDGVGDKAFSIGEGSIVEIFDCHVKRARIGVAGKDRSEAFLTKNVFDTCEIGLAVFTKKKLYGPAQVTCEGLQLNNVRMPYVLEADSMLVVDSIRAKPNARNVKAALYPAKRETPR